MAFLFKLICRLNTTPLNPIGIFVDIDKMDQKFTWSMEEIGEVRGNFLKKMKSEGSQHTILTLTKLQRSRQK
jgi:hypothetical protein